MPVPLILHLTLPVRPVVGFLLVLLRHPSALLHHEPVLAGLQVFEVASPLVEFLHVAQAILLGDLRNQLALDEVLLVMGASPVFVEGVIGFLGAEVGLVVLLVHRVLLVAAEAVRLYLVCQES